MVRVGERCQFDDMTGDIESIGIRSTRIRARDRSLITIANSDLAQHKIINQSRRDKWHFRHKIGLQYETSSDTLKSIRDAILDYLTAHDKVFMEKLRVRLVSFDDGALTLQVNAYLEARSNSAFLELQEALLFDIRAIIAANGSDFAYPSSTIYLTKDAGLQPAAGKETGEEREDTDQQSA